MNTDSIRVIGIDQSGIKQHSTNSEFIELPFILSCHPDETWVGICVSICGSTKPLVNRRMFVLNNTIIIVANIDDDLEKYKEAIEEVVEKTNKKFSQLLQKTRKEHAQANQEVKRNKVKLDEFKNKAAKLYK
ncbi:hypothetical protein JXB22_03605 [candidate division WOR-3 bacterium]|nr:hypothetical protein [candidate division WOR-3 bacterium]